MTGYKSKKAAAQDKLITVKEHGATKYAHLLMVKCFTEEYDKHRRTTMDDDDDTQVYQDHDDALTIAYQSGYYDGKKAAQPAQEPVAWLCKADENGLFGLPTADKACNDCFPVYTAPPQRTVQVSPLEFVEMVMDKEHLVGNPIVWAQWPNKEKNS